jgi:hypothetical protein
MLIKARAIGKFQVKRRSHHFAAGIQNCAAAQESTICNHLSYRRKMRLAVRHSAVECFRVSEVHCGYYKLHIRASFQMLIEERQTRLQ